MPLAVNLQQMNAPFLMLFTAINKLLAPRQFLAVAGRVPLAGVYRDPSRAKTGFATAFSGLLNQRLGLVPKSVR